MGSLKTSLWHLPSSLSENTEKMARKEVRREHVWWEKPRSGRVSATLQTFWPRNSILDKMEFGQSGPRPHEGVTNSQAGSPTTSVTSRSLRQPCLVCWFGMSLGQKINQHRFLHWGSFAKKNMSAGGTSMLNGVPVCIVPHAFSPSGWQWALSSPAASLHPLAMLEGPLPGMAAGPAPPPFPGCVWGHR